MYVGLRAKKLILGESQAFLVFAISSTKEVKKDLQDILVVQDYPDDFSTNYARLPPQRVVEFGIECVLSTSPKSKA
jgi:hypothetical protein